ncbi:MAG: phosphoribosyltransferase family protein [Candidatus Uhrbacteria bacterium]|nr:phosphoribosyltransferase family protein [Candidatus Uhrbacteria bacterium]
MQCVTAFHYSDVRVARMVHALKYDFVTKSAPALASCMVRAWNEYGGSLQGLCVPIPLHSSRRNERGFNQAELLAQECSREIGFTFYDNVLIRSRATPPQTELSREDHTSNIRDAFSCTLPDIVRGNDIVLVDDVYTTCATLQEAARVLKECGAQNIQALTFAHG